MQSFVLHFRLNERFFRVIVEYSRLGKSSVRENGSQFLSPVTNDASHRRWVSKHSLEMKTKGGRLDDSFYNELPWDYGVLDTLTSTREINSLKIQCYKL